MPTLTSDQLTELRQRVSDLFPVTWAKAPINLALQAVEDRFETVRASFGVAIENAAPGVFSALQKQKIVKFWLYQKFGRE